MPSCPFPRLSPADNVSPVPDMIRLENQTLKKERSQICLKKDIWRALDDTRPPLPLQWLTPACSFKHARGAGTRAVGKLAATCLVEFQTSFPNGGKQVYLGDTACCAAQLVTFRHRYILLIPLAAGIARSSGNAMFLDYSSAAAFKPTGPVGLRFESAKNNGFTRRRKDAFLTLIQTERKRQVRRVELQNRILVLIAHSIRARDDIRVMA